MQFALVGFTRSNEEENQPQQMDLNDWDMFMSQSFGCSRAVQEQCSESIPTKRRLQKGHRREHTRTAICKLWAKYTQIRTHTYTHIQSQKNTKNVYTHKTPPNIYCDLLSHHPLHPTSITPTTTTHFPHLCIHPFPPIRVQWVV